MLATVAAMLAGCGRSDKAETSIRETPAASAGMDDTSARETHMDDTSIKETRMDEAQFIEKLETDFYLQAGSLAFLDTAALASQGKLISCFGNNAGSGYFVPMLPPAPNQKPAPATQMGNFSWPAEEASIFYDETAENEPANPYFSPVGWTYKLRQDEAVVMIGKLPPKCKYFSFINYIFSSPLVANKEYTARSFFTYGDEESGLYHPVFASLGEPLNMNNIGHAGEAQAFDSSFVYIATGNKTTAETIQHALIEAGYPEKMINVLPFYADTLRMGLSKGSDVMNILMRVSQPEDSAAFELWVDSLPEDMSVYRITPKTQTAENAYAYPTLTPRGNGIQEVCTVPDARKVLDQIREKIIAQYEDEYTYEELSARIAVPEGMTGYLNDENAQGDNRDTTYLMTDDFTLQSDEDFIVVYGLNHVATGKATYANTVLYARPMLNGVVSLYDSMYKGSANEYLPGEENDFYYVIKMARTKMDEYTRLIPYSTGNPDGRFYGVDNGSTLLLAYRAYVEPATGVGPSYYEILYDRAIVFHKK